MHILKGKHCKLVTSLLFWSLAVLFVELPIPVYITAVKTNLSAILWIGETKFMQHEAS